MNRMPWVIYDRSFYYPRVCICVDIAWDCNPGIRGSSSTKNWMYGPSKACPVTLTIPIVDRG